MWCEKAEVKSFFFFLVVECVKEKEKKREIRWGGEVAEVEDVHKEMLLGGA